jgi:hypothetical protein
MNEIRVSTRAEFNPGAQKPTPVRSTAGVKVNVFIHGVPEATVKMPRIVAKAKKAAEFNPGAVKTVPVRTVVKAKVSTPSRVTAKATAKPRNFVIRTKAVSRAWTSPTGHLGKPHDAKSAFARCFHNPPKATIRNYRTTTRAVALVTYSNLSRTRDRKRANATCVFGSFSARPPSFRWT